MKFDIRTKNPKQPSNIAKTIAIKTNNRISKIEDLKKEKSASVSGGPQVTNDPRPQ